MKEKILKLPKTSGIYIFKNKNGKILYIGKATSLRSRVNSYFSRIRDLRIAKMVSQIADMEIRKTESVLEALILEANLIKKYQPKYNAMGKDDKSFAYFAVTKEEWPRVLILRRTDPGSVERKTRNVEWKCALKKTSNSRSTLQVSRFYGPYASKHQMEIALKIIRKIFPFHSQAQKTEKGCLDFQLGRCPGPYAGMISKKDYRKNIQGIKMILEGKKKSLIKKLEKEMQAYAKNNEFEKAAEMRNKIFALKHIQDVALISKEHPHPALRATFSLNREKGNMEKTFRVEAYDISDISGQHATGSMIVFANNKPDKSQYRKFRIKTVKGINDIGMMREVLLRRFKNDWPRPDLILLDGGVGHLNAGTKILNELKLNIPLVAVAKGPTRKISNFQFLISNKIPRTQLPKRIIRILDNRNLIKRIMAEAHRFAIGYHRKLRKRSLLD